MRLRQGQSVYTILQNRPEIKQCEKTLYNYIESGVLSVANLDLLKKVRYKPRQAHASEISNTGIFEGRTYKDYQAFISQNPDTRVTEIDTVVGCESSRKEGVAHTPFLYLRLHDGLAIGFQRSRWHRSCLRPDGKGHWHLPVLQYHASYPHRQKGRIRTSGFS